MRKPRIITGLLVLALGCAALSAWADDKKDDVDDIGDRKVAHRSIISQEKEIAIGKQYADQIDKQAKILKDPIINEYVNRVAQNLARNSDLTIPLTIKVIDDPAINAFTLPGGFMYLNTGTLLAADEEDQVAGVIAHEIGHAAARHWASQMTKQTIMQFSMIPLMFIPMSAAVYMGVMEAYMNGVPLAFLKFSRKDEQEADFLGLQYMYKAGYDPNAFVGFFGKVMDEERRSPGSMAKVFADHPPTGDRIIASEEEIQKILPKKPEYLVSTSEFDDIKARLQTVMTQHKRAQKGDAGPTLRKKEPTDKTSTTDSGQQQKPDSGDDQPPVLQRRD
jgi:beta-barrel assembly-enhancing protease